ncbi:MAG: VOC family protein, partial [Thermoplasmata archaeon]|nr:VOC family protein [Thermoplasmata archaeon]
MTDPNSVSGWGTRDSVEYSFDYTAIRVRDLERSIAFYRDLLGLRVCFRGPVESTGGEVVLLECNGTGQRLELNRYSTDGRFGAPYREGDELDHLAFAVDDVFAATEHLRNNGVKIKIEPPGLGRVPSAYALDPDGIWVELRPGRKRPGEAAKPVRPQYVLKDDGA